MEKYIDRNNFQDVNNFLQFNTEIKQNDPHTVDGYRYRLRHLLEWALDVSLMKASTIRPGFPAFLEKIKTSQDRLLSAAEFSSICKTTRAFFQWAKAEYPGRYRGIDNNWIMSIRPPRARSEQSEIHTRELYTVEEVIQMVTSPVVYFSQRRTQAAVALLFLSGMRIGAFMSLPINCVDLDKMVISQLPERGVLTKNRKAAITTLLDIPELFSVIRAWDKLVREKLDDSLCWYAHLDSHGQLNKSQPEWNTVENRRFDFCDDLQSLCDLAGVEYKSAHKLRHGHAVYALKLCETVAQFKSVSQNLMHANMGITDGVYGNLVREDVHDTIRSLAPKKVEASDPELQAAFEAMMKKYLGGKK